MNNLPPLPEGASLDLPPLPEGAKLDYEGGAPSFTGNKYQEGAVDVALTMATGGLASIAGGVIATGKLLFGNDFGETVEEMSAFNDAFTWRPRTEAGMKVLETIAPAMISIDQGADDIAVTLGMGNPLASTIIKTAIMGTLEFAAPAKGAAQTFKAARHLIKSTGKINKLARDMGISPNIREMKLSVVEAATKLVPDEKGAHAALLKQAMTDAEQVAKAAKNAAYEAAKTKKVWVDTRAVADLAATTRKSLVNNYDLSVMPKLNKRLGEMLDVPTGATRAKFFELEKVRRKIGTSMDDVKISSPSEYAALGVLKKEIDSFIDNEFNKTALAAGQYGPPQKMNITGDVAGITAWKEARELNRAWRQNFHTDKAIRDMISIDATPEVMTDWILGATAVGGKREAVQVVSRLKRVLGDNHPAIEGVRQDFLFRVAEPLLQEKPNFNMFIRNYDKMVKKNHSLVNELGLNESQFNDLVVFAREAAKLPPNQRNFNITDITRALSVGMFGHGIAKQGLKVSFSRKVFNSLFNLDLVSQKTLIADMAGYAYGKPMFPKNGPLAALFIASAGLNELGINDERVYSDPVNSRLDAYIAKSLSQEEEEPK